MGILKRVKSGDPLSIPAAAYNTIIDVVNEVRSRGREKDAPPLSVSPIKVANMTDDRLPIFAVLAIDGPAIDPTYDDVSSMTCPVLKGIKPTSDKKSIVILQEPAGKEEAVRVCIDGVSFARIDVRNADSAQYCKVVEGETNSLQADEAGDIPILWLAEEAGELEENERWAIVRLGGGGGTASGTLHGIVMEAITKPDDLTADPGDDENFRDAMGEIRIEGKSYKDADGNPIPFDKCCCRELAGIGGDEKEKLLKGVTCEIVKGGEYDNPNYDPEQPETLTNRKKIEWYVAKNTKGNMLCR